MSKKSFIEIRQPHLPLSAAVVHVHTRQTVAVACVEIRVEVHPLAAQRREPIAMPEEVRQAIELPRWIDAIEYAVALELPSGIVWVPRCRRQRLQVGEGRACGQTGPAQARCGARDRHALKSGRGCAAKTKVERGGARGDSRDGAKDATARRCVPRAPQLTSAYGIETPDLRRPADHDVAAFIQQSE